MEDHRTEIPVVVSVFNDAENGEELHTQLTASSDTAGRYRTTATNDR